MLDYQQRQSMIRAWAQHDARTYEAFRATVTPLLSRPLTALRILDLGCGSNAPMTAMLSAAGCTVTGVDHRVGYRWGLGFKPGRTLAYAREVGWPKALRKLVGEAVYDRTYYQELAARTGLALRDDGLDLREMDLQQPELPEGAYDLVHSNATWEHIADVPAANRTLARALAPGGLAYIEIHLFPSLSGGHDLPWIVPGETKLGSVKPWSHLRDPQWEAPVFLNRLRERDYRAAFEATPGLEVLDWATEFTEGHEYLTPEIRHELADYSEEELTKRSIIVTLRRTAATHAPAASRVP